MTQKTVPYIAVALLVLLWGFTLVHYYDLPEEIPIHFNAAGKADGFATRLHIWGLPIIAAALFFLLHRIQKRENIQSLEVQLLQWMQRLILATFCYIQIQTFLVALGRSEGLGTWFLPLSMVSFLLPIFWVVIKQQRS